MPLSRFGFPSVVVASSNDPYVTLSRAREYAQAWGSRLVDIGDAGHINGESGLGDWPEGWALLTGLRRAGR
jgi:predicted alpha/beta hydrolase family esterase